jgi:hypothetical protein
MALPSSGPISISAVADELQYGNYSLRALAAFADMSMPDSLSEFYGYSNVRWFETLIARTAFGDPNESCEIGQGDMTISVYYSIFQEGLFTSPGGEAFDGGHMWYYLPDFAGSFFIDSKGVPGEFFDCKK